MSGGTALAERVIVVPCSECVKDSRPCVGIHDRSGRIKDFDGVYEVTLADPFVFCHPCWLVAQANKTDSACSGAKAGTAPSELQRSLTNMQSQPSLANFRSVVELQYTARSTWPHHSQIYQARMNALTSARRKRELSSVDNEEQKAKFAKCDIQAPNPSNPRMMQAASRSSMASSPSHISPTNAVIIAQPADEAKRDEVVADIVSRIEKYPSSEALYQAARGLMQENEKMERLQRLQGLAPMQYVNWLKMTKEATELSREKDDVEIKLEREKAQSKRTEVLLNHSRRDLQDCRKEKDTLQAEVSTLKAQLGQAKEASKTLQTAFDTYKTSMQAL